MFGNNKKARDQQRIVENMRQKLNEKERCENDQERAQSKLKQNPSDSMAARELERATQSLERIERDFENLRNQL